MSGGPRSPCPLPGTVGSGSLIPSLDSILSNRTLRERLGDNKMGDNGDDDTPWDYVISQLVIKKKRCWEMFGRCLGDFSKGLQPEKTSWEILKTFLGRNIEMLSVGSSILRFSTFWDERTESRIDFVLFAKPWPTGSAVRLDLSWNLFDAQASIAGSAVFWMHGGWYGLL